MRKRETDADRILVFDGRRRGDGIAADGGAEIAVLAESDTDEPLGENALSTDERVEF